MSTPLSTAIYARLTGVEALTGDALLAQQGLALLLGTDPETLKPDVRFRNTGRAPQPINVDGIMQPLVTFGPSVGRIDGRFATGLLVDNPIYDFEIWEYSEAGTVITDIADCIERLLDRRRNAPAWTLGGRSDCAWSEAFVPLSTIYDDQRNGFLGLIRYRFIEGRA